MYCMYCGKMLPEGAVFCIHCGREQKAVKGSARESAIQPAPMPGHDLLPGQKIAMDGQVPLPPSASPTYVPEIAPKPMTEDLSKTVFRGGYERNVEKLMNIGVELSGIAILFMLVRLILSAFIRGYTMGRSDIYLSFLALAFLLATCVANQEKGKRMWLGLFPLALTALDYFLLIREENELNSIDDFGYNVGWSKYGTSLIIYGAYALIFLLLLRQKGEENRIGAILLAIMAMVALVYFMTQTTGMVTDDIEAQSKIEIWYDMFTGLHIICFHMSYLCIALRGILAKKEAL